MEYWLVTTPWVGVILWILLYISDYSLTIYCARGFRAIDHFQFEGSLELTPQFQKDVDSLQPISKRHVTLLILISLLLVLLWWLAQRVIFFPWAYLLFLGMFLLMEVGVHVRHFRNFFLIREIRKDGGVAGQISYRKWFSYRMSAFEFYMFTVLFLIVAVLHYSAFFLGGAFACLAIASKHNSLAKQAKTQPSPGIEIQA